MDPLDITRIKKILDQPVFHLRLIDLATPKKLCKAFVYNQTLYKKLKHMSNSRSLALATWLATGHAFAFATNNSSHLQLILIAQVHFVNTFFP